MKNLQRLYFLGLFAGSCDVRYVEDRLRVGAAHERIACSPRGSPSSERGGADVVVRSTLEFPIGCEDDVVVVRRAARKLAQERGFDAFAAAAVTTAASELARNALVHGGGGRAILEDLDDDGRAGLRVEFRHEGPGIADLERALAGGFSTMRSLGLGLSGSRRLVDELTIETQPGRGTLVRMVKWGRCSSRAG